MPWLWDCMSSYILQRLTGCYAVIFLISGDLMFHLNRILFSPHLKTIVTWEVTLFLIIKFLYKLVAIINTNRLCTTTLSLSSVKNYHKCFLQDFCNFETAEILSQIQREFIQIWMCLILWQICNKNLYNQMKIQFILISVI